jgi:hypothetical protein
MNYLWPLPHPDPVLDDALDIALAYLEATGQAKAGDDTQHLVATAVLAAWLEGRRHKIRLANLGIVDIIYKKVTFRFFVVSSINQGKIWYNRCNRVAGYMNCVLINYPAGEKRQWDDVVTRISKSLR